MRESKECRDVAGEIRGERSTVEPPESAPLGPDSLTFRYLGDLRNVLVATRAGLLQSMHPAIGAALIQHSDFFSNPWNRLLRSAGPVLGVVFDPRAEATAGRVRDYHRRIEGDDESGRRYHALDPATFYWAHATFFEGQIASQEFFGEPLSREAKEQLYRESVTWWARYGLPMDPVPADYAAFEVYWNRMLAEGLAATKAARISVKKPKRRLPAPYPWLRPVWWAVHPIVVDGSLFLTRVTLPEAARVTLGLSVEPHERRRLRWIGRIVGGAHRLLPERARTMPRAYRGIVAARASAGS